MMMAIPISTVLCDLDGTLIDSRCDIALAFQHALRHVVGGSLPAEAAIAQHIGKPLEHMARALGYRFSPAQLTAFLETYRQHYATSGTPHTQPYPGVTITLQALSSLTEGGANVISEALAADVPIVASRIAGSIGLLGEEYPGYFPVEDTIALARLLDRVESDAGFYQELQAWCTRLAPLVHPAREFQTWASLLQELAE